jgi:hypothetical protein
VNGRNESSSPTHARSERGHGWGTRSLWGTRLYCLLLVALPLLAVAGAVTLARTGWFLRRAVPNYVAMLNGEFAIRDQPCDVLLFGDSSALTGLMPWIIQQDTGSRTCSIAQTKGVVGVTGLDFLRHYLARNPAPRVLVIALAPEDWRHIRNWSETAYVEGMLEVVRHENFFSTARRFAAHPNEVFGFTTFVYKSAISAALHRGHGATTPQPTAREGQMTLPNSPERDCLRQGWAANDAAAPPPPSADFVRAVRAEFTPRAGSLLLISPPIAECDKLASFYAGILDPVLDSPISAQPIGDYNDLDRHFTARGAEIFSHRIAAVIQQRLQARKQLQ